MWYSNPKLYLLANGTKVYVCLVLFPQKKLKSQKYVIQGYTKESNFY